ncbi:MAG: UDP-N-acetylmuramate--L-alanine ligase [Myxococcales bacterium]|nr:UDP-N-acetylmuramate--L-alanine ligase [Myxococcales bacterium]
MRRRIQHVHFVGIGGIGMCGLAELLHNQGYRVSGTDLREGPAVVRLRGLGIEVNIGHDARHLSDTNVVVHSSAVRATNPELKEAERRKIPVIPRAEMLAEVMRLKEGIAIAGSHGKTTTTSLVAHVLGAAGLDPTAVIGGRVLAPDASLSTTRLGSGDVLVAEADESDGSFLRLAPVIGVITNIDSEHLDHYGSYEALEEAFVAFANRVPFWGLSVLCLDHPGVQAIVPRMTRRTITYGFSSQADLVATDVRVDGLGMRFSVRMHGEQLGEAHVRLPGRHNVLNALATLAVAIELEVPFYDAAAALESFLGIERRFELKGEVGGVRIFDDYGHHPAEIRATLAAARAMHDGRILVAFQPHRFTRTRDLWGDFIAAFNDADVLYLTEIYAAGEDKLTGIEAAPLVEAIRAHGHHQAHYVADMDELLACVLREATAGDLVITLGAGNINTLSERIVAGLRQRKEDA